MAVTHQVTSGLGTVDFTDHTTLVWLIDNSPHRRPKDRLTGIDWATGGIYLVYMSSGQHVFEGDIVFLGPSAAHPSRTLEDAQTAFNALSAQIEAAEKFGPSGGAQGAVVSYLEQFEGRSTLDTYTICHGDLEEPARYTSGGYIKSHLKIVCNKT